MPRQRDWPYISARQHARCQESAPTNCAKKSMFFLGINPRIRRCRGVPSLVSSALDVPRAWLARAVTISGCRRCVGNVLPEARGRSRRRRGVRRSGRGGKRRRVSALTNIPVTEKNAVEECRWLVAGGAPMLDDCAAGSSSGGGWTGDTSSHAAETRALRCESSTAWRAIALTSSAVSTKRDSSLGSTPVAWSRLPSATGHVAPATTQTRRANAFRSTPSRREGLRSYVSRGSRSHGSRERRVETKGRENVPLRVKTVGVVPASDLKELFTEPMSASPCRREELGSKLPRTLVPKKARLNSSGVLSRRSRARAFVWNSR